MSNGRFSRRSLIVGGAALGLAAGVGSGTGVGAAGRTAGRVAGRRPGSTPKTGGTLRVGVVGGTNDIIDGQYIVAKPDQARLVAGWETLVTYDDDFNVSFEQGLAESVEATARGPLRDPPARGHRVPRRQDARRRRPRLLVQPADRPRPRPRAAVADRARVRAASPRSTSAPSRCSSPSRRSRSSTRLAGYAFGIVPDGYTREGEQVGTGPFKLVSFTPGTESVHERHPNYWKEGKPYLDGVQIIDFADATALVNALLAGQVDCIADVPFAQVSTIEANGGFTILESQAGSFLPITMAVDQAPFDDVRVRQAFRLIVDRDEMVERVLSGYGRVANDLYSPFDACYASDLPQRTQDIEQAMALLEEAGQAGLEIDLFAPNDTAGLAEMAAVFADQAQGGRRHRQRAGARQRVLGRRVLQAHVRHQLLGHAAVPQPGRRRQPERRRRTRRRTGRRTAATSPRSTRRPLATVDQDERCAIVHEMQEEEYNDGGNIIAFFNSLLDAHHESVQGLVGRPNVLNLDHFGRGFANIWLDT